MLGGKVRWMIGSIRQVGCRPADQSPFPRRATPRLERLRMGNSMKNLTNRPVRQARYLPGGNRQVLNKYSQLQRAGRLATIWGYVNHKKQIK